MYGVSTSSRVVEHHDTAVGGTDLKRFDWAESVVDFGAAHTVTDGEV